ncbi:MAG: hypothetical protein ABI383_10890 [Acidobacteriaceae bacterium]
MLASAFDKRTVLAIAALAGVAVLAWFTMAADKVRLVTVVILGFFAFRIILGAMRRSVEENETREAHETHEDERE